MRRLRRTWVVVVVLAGVLTGLAILGIRFILPRRAAAPEKRVALKPEAPPDLEKLRDRYVAALDALRRKDGAGATKMLASFHFGGRMVEEYRLWHLSRAYDLVHGDAPARRVLALLWSRKPRAVVADAVATSLATRYAATGAWREAVAVASAGAMRAASPQTAASQNRIVIESAFDAGDLPTALEAAYSIAVRSPAAAEAPQALGVVRSIAGTPASLPLPFSFDERLERAVSLLRDQKAQAAFDELTALQADTPAALRDAVALNRGLALNQIRRYEDSNKILEPLTSRAYKIAIPALYTASRNYRALAASINPMVTKTITVRQQVGTRKVSTGKGKKKKVVAKPKFANVKKNVQLVDLAKKAKKDEWERLSSERLRDLLQLPQTAPLVRLDVLNTLIPIAEAKNQDPYERDLVRQVVAIDAWADPGLQHFWDKGWAAYVRGDLATAKDLFRFIADTYANPNVRRQSEYWYARTIERQGDKAAASAIYTRLAGAPYEDVYAIYARQRGANPPRPPATNPTKTQRPDWREIAEKSTPPELMLAYELTALTDFADAGAELDRNASPSNQKFADALRAEKLDHDGNLVEMYKAMKRAFPQLATIEQDAVPPFFLRLYYPVKYLPVIQKNAAKNGVDPYLVMALILQESYFDPSVKSRVGATGLMQIMPATGREIAQQLHGFFARPNLTNPTTNIEIGTVHLKHLLALFNGNPQLVAASYNAGQGNVLKWRRAAPGKPMDEFLESIPFAETRNYVKRVTMLRSAYSRIAE